jgi:hypothetical protein
LLPAGVPRRLLVLRAHIAAFLDGAPLRFLGIVLAVALGFRLVIGALAEEHPAAPAEGNVAEVTTAEVATAPASREAPAPPSVAGGMGEGEQSAAEGRPAPAPREKPRRHGRRAPHPAR